jgi:hypothetical protein
MEHHSLPILHSNYPSQHLSLDDSLGRRQPLSEAAGNGQFQALASIGDHHDTKGYPLQVGRSMYSTSTLHSQPTQPVLGNPLTLRRHTTRRNRQQRYSRNPIAEVPQFKLYRERQAREGAKDDQKWPDVLEVAFLDGTHFYVFVCYIADDQQRYSICHPWVVVSFLLKESLMVATRCSKSICGLRTVKVYLLELHQILQ